MADEGLTTVEHGGISVTSTDVSEKDMRASLAQADGEGAETKPDKPRKPTASEAASELGKRGGKAAAEKRAAEAREKPAEPQEGKPVERAEPPEVEGDDEGASDEELTKRQRRRVEVAARKQAEARRELERERHDREAERQRYEAELAAYRVHGGRERPPAEGQEREPAPRDASAKPRAEDFESYDDYLDARDEWNRGQWTREQERRQHADREVAKYHQFIDGFVKYATPDLKDAVDPEIWDMKPYMLMGDGERITADNLIAGEIIYLGAEAPAVLKHLSDNPDELERLRALGTDHPHIRIRLQRLGATLGSRPDATAGEPPVSRERASKPAPSKANPPVRPVTGAPYVADGDGAPREDEDFDAWYRRTDKRRSAQR